MIEHLLDEITERGWTVYQLCQSPLDDVSIDKAWRAYIRHPAQRLAYGQGHSAEEALLSAMDTNVFQSEPAIESNFDFAIPADPTFNLRSLVGLNKSPIKRRI